MRAVLVCAATAVLGSACVPHFNINTLECQADRDCRSGSICAQGTCQSAADAGARDASAIDASAPPDSGLRPGPCGLTNGGWIVAQSDSAPVARDRSMFSYSPASWKLTMFGGVAVDIGSLDDVWSWDGVGWQQEHPATRLPPRSSGAVAPDRHGDIVLFGGEGNDTIPLAETWTWDGVDLHPRTTTIAPPARSFVHMAYDRQRGMTVLFGGRNQVGTLGDTWEWDGDQWHEMHPPNSPSARHSHAIAYDVANARVVIFGGFSNLGEDSAVVLGDAWSYDGTSWSPLFQSDVPTPRGAASLAYDEQRETLVLFGGADGVNIVNETDELRGEVWTRVLVGDVEKVENTAMGTLLPSDQIFFFSGWNGGGHPPQTWRYCPPF